jgi:hypothetical protein
MPGAGINRISNWPRDLRSRMGAAAAAVADPPPGKIKKIPRSTVHGPRPPGHGSKAGRFWLGSKGRGAACLTGKWLGIEQRSECPVMIAIATVPPDQLMRLQLP